MPELGPQTVRRARRLERRHRGARPGRARRAPCDAITARRDGGGLVVHRLSRGRRRRERRREHQGTVRVHRADRRGAHDHRAHARRHRLGLGGRDAPRLVAASTPRRSARARSTRRGARANPVAIEPGRYTVILEPTAVGNLVQLITGAMNARSADEGRSLLLEAGRRQQDRHEGRGRARDDRVRPARSRDAGRTVHRRRAADAAHACGSRTAS